MANDLITFLRNYDYDICLAKGTKWTLEEAVDYLAAYLANRQKWTDREDAYKGFSGIRSQLMDAVNDGIDEGRLIVDEVFKEGGAGESGMGCHEIDLRKSTIVPIVFINWAIEKNIQIPKQYVNYAAKNNGDKSTYYERLGVKKTSIHHERCRAVAELLWSMEPEITIAEMARRSEVLKFGCEGHEYDMRTISRWLATLKPDRRPGRRKKRYDNENALLMQTSPQ